MTHHRTSLRNSCDISITISDSTDDDDDDDDSDRYESDEEDTDGVDPLSDLKKQNRPSSFRCPSRRQRVTYGDCRPKNRRLTRRLPYRLPDALMLPPIVRSSSSSSSSTTTTTSSTHPSRRTTTTSRTFPSESSSSSRMMIRSAPSLMKREASGLPPITRPSYSTEQQRFSQLSILATTKTATFSSPKDVVGRQGNDSTRISTKGTTSTTTNPVSPSEKHIDRFITALRHEEDKSSSSSSWSNKHNEPRRFLSLPFLGRRNRPSKDVTQPPSPPISHLARRSKSISDTFEDVCGIRESTTKDNSDDDKHNSHDTNRTFRSKPRTFLATYRSKSISKSMNDIMDNHDKGSRTIPTTTTSLDERNDVWIEKVMLRHGRPHSFYFQSILSSKIQSEPPTGAMHVVYLDDLWRQGFISQQQQQQQQGQNIFLSTNETTRERYLRGEISGHRIHPNDKMMGEMRRMK